MLTETHIAKEAFDSAHKAIDDVNKSEPAPMAAMPPAPEMDLFTFDSAPTPMMAPAPAPAPYMSEALAPAQVMAPAQAPTAPAVPMPVETISPGGTHANNPSPGLANNSVPMYGGYDMANVQNSNNDEYGRGGAMGAAPAAPTPALMNTNSYGGVPSVRSAPSTEHLDGLKSSMRAAQETANDAEAHRRQLAKQADVFRREADAAENAARAKDEEASQQKKKGFGRGKKKELVRGCGHVANSLVM